MKLSHQLNTYTTESMTRSIKFVKQKTYLSILVGIWLSLEQKK